MEDLNIKKDKKKLKWWQILLIVIVVIGSIGGIASLFGGIGGVSTYYIGETVVSGDLQCKVTKVEDCKQIGNGILGGVTNNNYIVVTVSLKNIGNTELNLTSSNFRLKCGDSLYEPSTDGIYGGGEYFYALETLGAKMSTTTKVVFETPMLSNSSVLKFGFCGSILDSYVGIYLTSRPLD